MSARKLPGISKARAHVLASISNAKWDSQGRLRPARELAAEAGVSTLTVLKAMRSLADEGIVIGSARRRFCVAAAVAASNRADVDERRYHPLVRTKTWERTADAIRQRILIGEFAPGSVVPSRKELSLRYGIHPATLRKALASLCGENLITPRGAHFRVADLVPRDGSARIVVLVPCDAATRRPLSIFAEEFIRCVEMQCATANLALSIMAYTVQDEAVRFGEFGGGGYTHLRTGNDVMGYLFMVPAVECGREVVLDALMATRKPLAVLDEQGEWFAALRSGARTRLKVFSPGVSWRPAQAVGRYLLSLGHRAFAFLSPFNAAPWSIRRYEGLKSLLVQAGEGYVLRKLTLDDYAGGRDFRDSGDRNCRAEDFLGRYQEWRANLPREFVSDADSHMYDALQRTSRTGEVRRRLLPLLEQALADRAITAWIMSDDYCASMALDFLREHRVDVPNDVSVISFDDTPEAVYYSLTSYNFNIPGNAHAMLGYVLDRPALSLPPGIAEIDGLIVKRRSVGPASAAR